MHSKVGGWSAFPPRLELYLKSRPGRSLRLCGGKDCPEGDKYGPMMADDEIEPNEVWEVD